MAVGIGFGLYLVSSVDFKHHDPIRGKSLGTYVNENGIFNVLGVVTQSQGQRLVINTLDEPEPGSQWWEART